MRKLEERVSNLEHDLKGNGAIGVIEQIKNINAKVDAIIDEQTRRNIEMIKQQQRIYTKLMHMKYYMIGISIALAVQILGIKDFINFIINLIK